MSINLLTIILIAAVLIAFGIGYYLASRTHHFKIKRLGSRNLPADYYMGLNYLINEKPDNAIDAFINLLKVDSDTIETHLALGNLFRKQGEVERAIRIHQNLIARPELSGEHKRIALYALAQDYLSAGVLGRAEKIFLSLVSQKSHLLESSRALMRIYQQEKEWLSAIEFAKKIQAVSDRNMKITIAQFYCELAAEKIAEGNGSEAKAFLKQAKGVDKQCVRINVLKAEIAMQNKAFLEGIKYLKEVAKQDPILFLEFIPQLSECYRQLNAEQDLVDYLNYLYAKQPSATLLVALCHATLNEQGLTVALNEMTDYITDYTSLISLNRYVDLAARQATPEYKKRFAACQQVLQQNIAEKAQYQCLDCGYAGKRFYWSCPSCLHWGSVKPIANIT